jgi:DNA-binding MarR family transcriptional regulator
MDPHAPEQPPPIGSLLFDVFVLGQAVRRLLASAMEESPLTPEEYAIHSVVFEHEQVAPTQMARELSMPLTTVMDHLRAMDRRGHIHRIPNPRDGRSYLIVLSAAGLAAHREANRLFERAHAAFVAALPGDAADARTQLAALIDAADAAERSVAPAP